MIKNNKECNSIVKEVALVEKVINNLIRIIGWYE